MKKALYSVISRIKIDLKESTIPQLGYNGETWNMKLFYLFVTVVKDEDDGSGEEDGYQADTETEYPIIGDTDVEVERGEQGAPQNHIQHLREPEESL